MGLDVRGFVVGIIIWLYTKVFRKEAGPVTRNFMRNVVYVFIGLFVAKLLSLFFQIYVGRSIGAAEYGKYSFVFSVSQFLWVPMLMGVGMATVKYLSSERDDRERKKIVSTGTSIVIMFSLLFSAVFYLPTHSRCSWQPTASTSWLQSSWHSRSPYGRSPRSFSRDWTG